MCALLRLVREIKVMYAEKMKMEILRREKNISTPPTRKSVDSCCQPGEKLIRLVLAGLWQLVSNLTDRRSLRAASHHSVFFGLSKEAVKSVTTDTPCFEFAGYTNEFNPIK